MLIRTISCFLILAPAFAAPQLTYSTYLRDGFTPNAIATDAAGNIYLAGSAVVDPGTSQTTALVVKLNPQATQYLYVRYIGGSVYDSATAIAVDSAGNSYVAGTTASPDFPVTDGGNLATAPAGTSNERSFVVKLDPNGVVLFSDILGGSANNQAQAVAVSAASEIVVSGTSISSGFPATAGAYSISNSANHPYLLALDPTGTKLVFSATGIGGSALAVDGSGNIYMAGTTNLLDYPTTPGAYQTTFPAFGNCTSPSCFTPMQGPNQYVTKVNPTASNLIFSTSISGASGTVNGGMAVDSAGDVYLTGFAAPSFPYTVTPPAVTMPSIPFISGALPYVTKLDAAGAALLFSVPVGGAGVQVDSTGDAYVGGMAGLLSGISLGIEVGGNLPALADVPAPCLPNNVIPKASYVSQVDGSGNVLGTQFIGGSTINIAGAALTQSQAGSTLWIAGPTTLPDFPFSPNALTIPNLQPGGTPGAYLGAVNFAEPQASTEPQALAGTPQIACIVDAASFTYAGPVAPYQLLTMFGAGLGPSTPVAASNYTTTELAGVSVGAAGNLSPLLYVSANQINFAVPAEPPTTSAATMEVTVNGVSSAASQLPLTFANPSLFLGAPPSGPFEAFATVALALNADGSVNSSSNPARLGSVISLFLNGTSPNSDVNSAAPQFTSNLGWTVTGYGQANPFVLEVHVQSPLVLEDDFECSAGMGMCEAIVQLFDVFGTNFNSQAMSASGLVVGGAVYVSATQ
jgi:uncharacterized protein (TIGR03437 family)